MWQLYAWFLLAYVDTFLSIQRALPPITGAILAGQVNVVEFFTKQNDLDCSLEGVSDI